MRQTASIENWTLHTFGAFKVLSGEVYGHPKFVDGSEVRTSLVETLDLDNRVAKTLNTDYTLGQERVREV